MPKFYVESGPIRLIFDASTAEQAAVMAFQWTCDKQALSGVSRRTCSTWIGRGFREHVDGSRHYGAAGGEGWE